MTWSPKPRKWPWRDFLTEHELEVVTDLDRAIQSARQTMAQAAMIRNPIVNRAIHRAKYAAGKVQP